MTKKRFLRFLGCTKTPQSIVNVSPTTLVQVYDPQIDGDW